MFGTKTSIGLGVLHSDKSTIVTYGTILLTHMSISETTLESSVGLSKITIAFIRIVLKLNIHIVGEG